MFQLDSILHVPLFLMPWFTNKEINHSIIVIQRYQPKAIVLPEIHSNRWTFREGKLKEKHGQHRGIP